MNIELIDRWDDISGEGNENYLTIEFDNYDRVDVKRKEDGFTYVMMCANGYEVYKSEDNEDGIGYRNTTDDELEVIMQFAKEQFEIEEELNINSNEVISANAEYTGGGIYRLTGRLKDGRYLIGSSDWNEIYDADADPDKDEDSWYNEWYDEHVVETFSKERHDTIVNKLVTWIEKNKPEGNYQIEELKRLTT